MGMFLSMTSVIGRTKNEVVNSLTDYARSAGGGLEKENLEIDNDNCCVIEEVNGNTTIFNPSPYLEWDKSSQFISNQLSAPVFSFHIHDGDLWMYVFFVDGEIADQFNPIPDYWDADITDEELQSWKGNAAKIAHYVKSAKQSDIEKYLKRWDPDAEESEKAFADDEFAQEDWQLLDFMKKLGLPYPLDDNGSAKGETFKLWTKDLPLKAEIPKTPKIKPGPGDKKPWWKIW
jgi:hypothetical protein